MKIRLLKSVLGRDGVIAGRVLDAYDSEGLEYSGQGPLWIRCPRPRAGYLKLEKDEWQEHIPVAN
jgi:hypothetical protein